MSRYIDAEKLALKWMLSSPEQKETFRQIIDEEPTADVVEVRHGEWGFDGIGWTCSECGEYALYIKTNLQSRSKYCPNCGADMRGEKNGKE